MVYGWLASGRQAKWGQNVGRTPDSSPRARRHGGCGISPTLQVAINRGSAVLHRLTTFPIAGHLTGTAGGGTPVVRLAYRVTGLANHSSGWVADLSLQSTIEVHTPPYTCGTYYAL